MFILYLYYINLLKHSFKKFFKFIFKKYYYRFLKNAESLDPKLQKIMEDYIEHGPEVIKNMTYYDWEMLIV